MSVLKVLKNIKNLKELRGYRTSCACFQSTEISVERNDEIIKSRRFLKKVRNIELKPFNTNFVSSIFGRSFDKELLEYPQVFEERDIDAALKHGVAIEEFLNDNPKNQLNKETISKLRELELFGLTIPQRYGGAEYNRTELNFLLESTGADAHIGRFIGINEDFGCRLLSIYGTEEQKAKYLPRLAEGQSFMTLGYIENGPIVDFSNFNAYSINDTENNGYILNANKKWVHFADVADLYLILAKKTTFLEEEDASAVMYNMFITERSNPGVKVHKVLTNSSFQDFSLFEIDCRDVFVPEKNLLGGADTCGIQILKTALSHNFLSDATFCCSLIKRIIHDACKFATENKVFEKLDKGYIMTHNNISSLTMYAYALESVIYLLSGRFDLHEEHDLFDESILGKIIAVEMLHSAIQRYIEILGQESLRASSLLDEALSALQYYSVLDENIEYLKLIVGSNGIGSAAIPLSDKVRKLRNPADNYFLHLKEVFMAVKAEDKIKKMFKIAQDLHVSLKDSADLFESTLSKFLFSLEIALIKTGSLIMENEHNIMKFAEIAAYLYAVVACLSRATSSICYDFTKFEFDQILADKFAYIACHKVESLLNEEVDFRTLYLLYKNIGKFTFSNKEYPVQHPLTRTY